MLVTFTVVADKAAEPISLERRNLQNDPLKVLTGLSTSHAPAEQLQSSVDGRKGIIVMENGFVRGVLLVYIKHHNLVVW